MVCLSVNSRVCLSEILSVFEFDGLLTIYKFVDLSVSQSSSQSFGLLVCPPIILSFCLVYQSITLSTRKTVSLSFFQSMTFTGYRSVILTVCHFVRLLVICVSISQSVRQLVCPDMSHSSLSLRPVSFIPFYTARIASLQL